MMVHVHSRIIPKLFPGNKKVHKPGLSSMHELENVKVHHYNALNTVKGTA